MYIKRLVKNNFVLKGVDIVDLKIIFGVIIISE